MTPIRESSLRRRSRSLTGSDLPAIDVGIAPRLILAMLPSMPRRSFGEESSEAVEKSTMLSVAVVGAGDGGGGGGEDDGEARRVEEEEGERVENWIFFEILCLGIFFYDKYVVVNIFEFLYVWIIW
ncbi:hypothetical protein Droror1_Dr00013616 [Drosera rotundifolia]